MLFSTGINAFDYMILGRMVYYFLPEQKLFHVHATKFSICFVGLDIMSFLVQATGGIILSGTNESQHLLNIGKDIYMAGIGMQQFFISIFVVLAVMFHRRALVLDEQGTLSESGKRPWSRLLYALYASLALITVGRLFQFTVLQCL
jgi:RTA1 like protein